jgi:exopolysaccharide biosynthesis polyprenyl glycosylphosphotransferase
MFRRYSINFAIFSMLADGLCVLITLAIADHLRPMMSRYPLIAEVLEPTVPVLLYILFPIAWVGILLLLQVYDGRRNLYIVNELTSLTIGSLIASVSLAGSLYLSYRDVSRFLFLFFAAMAYLSMISWRLVVRLAFHLNQRYQVVHNVLIIGAGQVGEELETQIQEHFYMGLRVSGYLDDDPRKKDQNHQILGQLTDARDVIVQHKVDDVVIALPRRAHEEVSKLVAELHDLPVKIWVIPDYFHLALHKAQVAEFAGFPMLDLRAPALNEYQRFTKRVFDLVLGTIMQILFFPIMGIIALAIRMDTPGPVLYKSQRVGENGRLFWMYKFRTMVKDADQQLAEILQLDENGHLIHKIPDDPRRTRVGKFLRRTSLDEIPQLFNVLKGEMSLIGPRPELPSLVKNYEPWQRKRFAVPQGITGWWQINGRSDKPMHLHTEDDIYYVQNYSLGLDIFILLKTIMVVLRGKGAY